VNLIAIGGVMAGVAVLIVVTSVMDGFRERVLVSVRGNLSDITMTPMIPEHVPLPPFRHLDQLLRQDPRVAHTAPYLSFPAFYLYAGGGGRSAFRAGGHDVFQLVLVGIDWDREIHVSKIADYMRCANDEERPFYSLRALDREREGTVLVSQEFAENFLGLGHSMLLPQRLLETDVGITFLYADEPGGGPDPPPGNGGGQGQIRAGYSTYQMVIAGLYDSADTSMDASRMFMDIDRLRRVAGLVDEYHQIRVKLHDYEDALAVKRDFQRDYPDFLVQTWEDQRRQYLKAVNNEKVLLVIVLSFIVLLGGFIILATLTLTVVEKTKDIGVLAALGASRTGILRLFLGNGLLIGVLGAVLGLGLGYWFTSNVNAIKDFLDEKMGIQIFPADIYLFRDIPTIWSWPTVFWIMGGSIMVAFFAGLFPALRAARMDPVKALRYE
jgi:lipoprotein-releasing system permease protein